MKLNVLETLKKRIMFITSKEAGNICYVLLEKHNEKSEECSKCITNLLELMAKQFFEAIETKEYETGYDWALYSIAKNPMTNETTLKTLTKLTKTQMMTCELAQKRLFKD